MLIMNKRKKREDKLIYTNRNIWYLPYLTVYKTHIFRKNVREYHAAYYKLKSQLWVAGYWISSSTVIFKLNHKHLHQYKQGYRCFNPNNDI